MEHAFRLIIIITCLRYMDGLLCPTGYRLSRETLVVDSVNLTWSEAAMECSSRNGTIIKVMDNKSKQIVKDTMEKYSLGKAWVGYTGDIEKMFDQDTREPYFIMKNVLDKQFYASSYKQYAKRAKIDSKSAWTPQHIRLCQWVQIDLKKTMCIHGIVTKGRKDASQWTKVYKLHYRKDTDTNFLTLQNDGREELIANTDSNTPVYRNFTKPFNAQIIRLYPQKWEKAGAVRFDLLVSDNSCPTDFTCGKCPAIVTTTTGNVTIQYESCCSKLPYICETETCDQDKKESSTAATVTSDNNPGARNGIHSPSNSITTGLIIGLVFFIIVSVILLILLIFLNRNFRNLANTAKPKDTDNHEREIKKQSVAMVTPNLHLKTGQVKDLYSQVDVKTKCPKSGMIYTNTETYDTIFDTTQDAKDKATYEDVATDDITDTELYHTPTDVDVNSVEQKEDHIEIPDGIEMFNNELYSDA
ncbi:unnamed protein product [Owenia fusiformis]|uniref:Uncharacterized protein n=1 Tax=Owenia fusiformis TaxID=6347 RepID=A0A8J1U5S4_OWEFU|nr:unnamed protein product [Owenia fusiformis]